jgi:hypothetical protein
MVSIVQQDFAGQVCLRLANESLSLWATTGVGPRILGLAPTGGENLFSQVPDLALDCPGKGAYHFHGGHRLWYAPEDPARTYLPDEQPVTIRQIDCGIEITQPTEPETGLQKQITIRLPGPETCVQVTHTIRNLGAHPVELAPWAITQIRTGGEALMPIGAPLKDEAGLLPNRILTFWPYSNPGRPQLRFGQHLLRFISDLSAGAFKIGFPNPSGWLAYRLGETLFVKQAPFFPAEDYYDLGSSSEFYCNAHFVELESLGPRTTLQPDESASHPETWKLYSGISFPEDEIDLIQTLKNLGLDIAGEAL